MKSKLTYIGQLNGFWKFYDDNKDKINTSDITLYMVLLRYCNKIGWKETFSVNPYIMDEMCPLAINTYYKSLANLHKLNIIIWDKGKHNVSNQKITIINFANSLANSLANNNNTINTYSDPFLFSESVNKETTHAPDKKDLNYFITFFEQRNIQKKEAEKFYYYYEQTNWKTKNGNNVENKDAAAQNWINRIEENEKEKSSGKKEKNYEFNTEILKDPNRLKFK